MKKSRRLYTPTFFLALVLLAAAMPLGAQTSENHVSEIQEGSEDLMLESSQLDSKAAIGPFVGFIAPPPLDPRVIWQQTWICRSGGPAEVQGFQVVCNGATFLDFHIADCCIPGDHWQLKGKVWDTHPNTAVTTSPGPANAWGVPGRAYNNGGTIFNPGNLNSYVQCTMNDGVNVFLADSFVSFSSDGNCAVTPDAMRRRIDRTP